MSFEQKPWPEGHEQIDRLMTLVLSGEATDQEASQFEQCLKSDASLKQEFEELKLAYRLLKTEAPLIHCQTAVEPAFPEYRMGQLKTSLNESFPKKRTVSNSPGLWERLRDRFGVLPLGTAFATLLLLLGVGYWQRDLFYFGKLQSMDGGFVVAKSGSPVIVRNGNELSLAALSMLQKGDILKLKSSDALSLMTATGGVKLEKGPARYEINDFVPSKDAAQSVVFETLFHQTIENFVAMVPLSVQRGGWSCTTYSPRGYTLQSPLLLIFPAESGEVFDVKVTSEMDGDFKLTSTVTKFPFDLDQLNTLQNGSEIPDGFYKLTVYPAGKQVPISETHFQLDRSKGRMKISGTDLEKLEAAKKAATGTSPRYGDALAALFTLSKEYSDSEFVLRLKLISFAKLGFEKEYYDTLRHIETYKTASRH